ncbi:DUF2892 domain-containing protein [Candidatus Gracilibacteria bacterium]|nr:DUF2892 domain-containing protein [Candidatus Gracilibacteria bacterium]
MERIIFLFAGSVIALSTGLAFFFDVRWLAVTGFVGFMQIIFAVTGYCPLAIILDKMGVKSYREK